MTAALDKALSALALDQSRPSIPRVTVFDIPLLVDLVALDLTPREIQRCTRVCRSFLHTFYPHLSRGIYITRRATHNKVVRLLESSREKRQLRGTRVETQERIDLTKIHTVESVFADTFRVLREEMNCLRQEFDVSQEQQYARVEKPAAAASSTVTTPRKNSDLALPSSPFLHNSRPSPSVLLTRPCFNHLTTICCSSLPLRSANLQQNHLHVHHILDVVDASPRLHTLELWLKDMTEFHLARFLQTFRNLGRQLKTLRIRNCGRRRVSDHCVRTLLWSCAAVESLTLDLEMYNTRGGMIPDHVQLELRAMAQCALASSSDPPERKHMDSYGYYSSPENPLPRWSYPPPVWCSTFECSPGWDKEPLKFCWKKLEISYSITANFLHVFVINEHCPDLEILTMPIALSPFLESEIRTLMANNLPRLRVLDMHRFGDDISDRAMVDVLKAVAEASTAAKVIGLIPTTSASPGVSPSTFSVQNDYPGVQSLTIQGTKFPLPNLVSLIVSPSEPFIHSLETLVLKGCWRLKSFELQRILTSCVNLVRLEAQTIQSNASPHSLAIPLWQLPTWYNPDHFAFDSRMDPIFKIQDLCSVDGAAEKESNNLIDVSSSTSSSLISWQCLKLERLHLCYEEPSQDEGQASAQRPLVGLPQMLWQQISRLERLEDLCLYRINPSNEITPTDGITDTEKTMLAGTRTGAFKVIDFESLPKTPTTKEQFRAALEDWHVSLTRLRRIQLQGLYAFVDPIAWRAYQQKMFPRLEWARLH